MTKILSDFLRVLGMVYVGITVGAALRLAFELLGLTREDTRHADGRDEYRS
jgi:hypothetical protein